MYNWSRSLREPNSLGEPNSIVNSSSITCDVDNDPYPLFLVMQAYTEEVLPSCPKEEGCTCTIQNYKKIKHQKKVAGEIYGNYVYSVKVSCSGKGLDYFPKLPKYTRYLDLSNNKVSNSLVM